MINMKKKILNKICEKKNLWTMGPFFVCKIIKSHTQRIGERW